MRFLIRVLLGLAVAATVRAEILVENVTTANQIAEAQVQALELPEQAHALSQYLSHNYGIVQVNSYNPASFYISNSSNQEVRLGYPTSSGMYFSVSNGCPSTLRPYGSCYLRVTYWPMMAGFHFGNVYMSSTDGTISITLNGQAQ